MSDEDGVMPIYVARDVTFGEVTPDEAKRLSVMAGMAVSGPPDSEPDKEALGTRIEQRGKSKG